MSRLPASPEADAILLKNARAARRQEAARKTRPPAVAARVAATNESLANFQRREAAAAVERHAGKGPGESVTYGLTEAQAAAEHGLSLAEYRALGGLRG